MGELAVKERKTHKTLPRRHTGLARVFRVSLPGENAGHFAETSGDLSAAKPTPAPAIGAAGTKSSPQKRLLSRSSSVGTSADEMPPRSRLFRSRPRPPPIEPGLVIGDLARTTPCTQPSPDDSGELNRTEPTADGQHACPRPRSSVLHQGRGAEPTAGGSGTTFGRPSTTGFSDGRPMVRAPHSSSSAGIEQATRSYKARPLYSPARASVRHTFASLHSRRPGLASQPSQPHGAAAAPATSGRGNNNSSAQATRPGSTLSAQRPPNSTENSNVQTRQVNLYSPQPGGRPPSVTARGANPSKERRSRGLEKGTSVFPATAELLRSREENKASVWQTVSDSFTAPEVPPAPSLVEGAVGTTAATSERSQDTIAGADVPPPDDRAPQRRSTVSGLEALAERSGSLASQPPVTTPQKVGLVGRLSSLLRRSDKKGTPLRPAESDRGLLDDGARKRERSSSRKESRLRKASRSIARAKKQSGP